MKTALIVLVLLTEFIAVATAAPLPLKVGEPFVVTRARLYAQGWRPDMSAHAVGEYSALERDLIRGGYPEVDHCSVGKSSCNLHYIKGSECLQLQTQGEQIRWMKVETWTNDCRPRAKDEPADLLPSDVRFFVQWRRDCDDFGMCDGVDAFSKVVKRRYARNPAISKILKSYDLAAEARPNGKE